MKVTVILNGVLADQNTFKAAVMAAIAETWDLSQIKAAVKHGLGIQNDNESLLVQ